MKINQRIENCVHSLLVCGWHGEETQCSTPMYVKIASDTALQNSVPLVQMWGNNKFLFFYFSSGIGAAIIQLLAYYLNINSVTNDLLANGVTYEEIQNLLISGSYNTGIIEFVSEKRLSSMYYDFNSVMVGASGAIYGIVVAFAFLFPNSKLMLLIPPVPIKAKYLVPLLILGDLFFGFTSASIGNIAHFAHIGGAITGFMMMWYWKRNQFNRNRWN